MTDTTTALTPGSAHRVLERACRTVGLDAEDAVPARFGENAMYRLQDAALMARVGRSQEVARKEVHVAEWLASHDFPAVRLTDRLAQPLVVDGSPVTFWELITESDDPVTSADLGRLLRALHSLPAPTHFTLPQFDPMSKVVARLDGLSIDDFTSDDIEFLRDRHLDLERQFTRLHFVLPQGPIHGDAHTGNLIRSTDGQIKLLDFEDFCYGPREWDVAVESVRYRSFAWVSESDYRDYTAAYGFDALNWPGFQVVRAARELNMTTWLMQQIGQSPEVDAEVKLRIADLHDDDAPRRWRAV